MSSELIDKSKEVEAHFSLDTSGNLEIDII